MGIIAIANQKGGCGKTTTAINLASSLVTKEKRVLLIDCDPQSHATLGLNIEPEHDRSMYGVMSPRQSEQLRIKDIIIPIKEGFHLAPSNITLSAVEQEFAGLEGRENRLKEAVEGLEDEYDFVLIDCPPSIGHLCFNALRASDAAIIPIDMSLFSLRGVAKLMDLIGLIQEKCGHRVRARALVTMYDYRTRYSRQVLEKVKDRFGGNVFKTVIRYNIRLRETVDHGLPVGDYDKHAIGHKDYENLASEILDSEEGDTTLDQAQVASTDEIQGQIEQYMHSISDVPMMEELPAELDEDFLYGEESAYEASVSEESEETYNLSSEEDEETKRYA